MMKIRIDDSIFERFPGLNIGVVIAKDLDNKGSDEKIISKLREEQKKIRAGFDTETLSQNPKISAWREAYSSFGAKPKKYRCSVENLYRMILEGIELSHINKIVDIYNYISIKHMLPAGGDDTDKVEGDIRLTFAKGDEQFMQLNSSEASSPHEGEVVYMDDKEVLCRRWNWRECDKSKMTEETQNVALVVEGLPPFTKEDIENIIKELSESLTDFCGGNARTIILNKENPEADM